MLGSRWGVGEGERRSGGGDWCAGSGVSFTEMERSKVVDSVWRADEASLSPPIYGVPTEESSEDCEDYTSGLAEEIAQSMLQDDDDVPAKTTVPWGNGLLKPAWSGHQMASSPTSPQSTLTGYNWDARSPRGNMGSSGVSSPATPLEEADVKDVLYADLLRLKLEDQVKLASQQRMLSPKQQIIQRSSNVAAPSNESLALDECSAPRTRRKSKGGDQELENYPYRGGSKHVGAGWGKGSIDIPTTSNCRRREEAYHQFSLFASGNMEGQNKGRCVVSNRSMAGGGGGMRAVFLGPPTSRECGGTGVFLPRRLGSTQDSKRKPACSTVLLPSRIVHALKLNIEDTLPSPYRRDLYSWNSHFHHNDVASQRFTKSKDEVCSYFPTSHSTTLQEVAPNISLPSEWTY